MNRPLTLDTRVRRNPIALWREFEHEIAVILPTAAALRTLNEVAGRCWQLADGRTIDEIVALLVNEYVVERTRLETDVLKLFAELDARGLLEAGEP